MLHTRHNADMLCVCQDVAGRLRAASCSLSSGPPGPDESGQPVGAVEDHTQEGVQRPGEWILRHTVYESL